MKKCQRDVHKYDLEKPNILPSARNKFWELVDFSEFNNIHRVSTLIFVEMYWHFWYHHYEDENGKIFSKKKFHVLMINRH